MSEPDTRSMPSPPLSPQTTTLGEGRRQRVSSSRRILVMGLQPQIEGGRYALRRIVGDRLRIHADVHCDGDLVVRACILYRVPGESRWRPAPMRKEAPGGVHWSGTLRLQNGGRTQYGLEAWVDVFATWQKRLQARVATPVDAEGLRPWIEEGAVILDRALQSAGGADMRLLAEKSEELRSVRGVEDLDRWWHDRELHKRMLVYGERRHVVRTEPALDVIVERKRAAFCTWCHLPSATPVPETGAAGTLRRMSIDVLHRQPHDNRAASDEPARIDLPGCETAVDLPLPEALKPDWSSRHPEWFPPRRVSGTDAHPAAPPPSVDFWCEERDALWEACLDVALEDIRRGAQVLVASRASQVPFAFWEWLTTQVHRQHPEVLFVGRPGNPARARALAACGFSQAIVDWDGSVEQARRQIVEQVKSGGEWRPCPMVPARSGRRLDDGRVLEWTELRLTQLLAAMSSGCFGFSGLPAEDEAAPWLQRLVTWRRETHALQLADRPGLLASTDPQLLALSRVAPGGRSVVLVIANLNPERQLEGQVDLPPSVVEAASGRDVSLEDLVDGARYTWSERGNFVRLGPHAAHVLRVVRRSGLLV